MSEHDWETFDLKDQRQRVECTRCGMVAAHWGIEWHISVNPIPDKREHKVKIVKELPNCDEFIVQQVMES
jgi:hypothetical protein